MGSGPSQAWVDRSFIEKQVEMLQIPPMPSWNSLHPFIVHFPIALLLLCPLFILISTILPPPKGRPYMAASLLVLLLGTVAIFVSMSTGEATGVHSSQAGPATAILKSHRDLADETSVLFSGLSIILIGVFALPQVLKQKETRLFSTVLPLAYLALYSVGIVFLANTTHTGGRLVHEYGVHSAVCVTGGLSALGQHVVSR